MTTARLSTANQRLTGRLVGSLVQQVCVAIVAIVATVAIVAIVAIVIQEVLTTEAEAVAEAAAEAEAQVMMGECRVSGGL